MPVDFRQDRRYAHLTPEQVFEHFCVERELRQAILDSTPKTRSTISVWAYEELFRRIPWHPALTEASGFENDELIERRIKRFAPILAPPPLRILEIGCGMGELMIGLSRIGYNCTGIDLSITRLRRLTPVLSEKLRFLQVDGHVLPFASNSFDAVISMQLFEHLHPDDVAGHLGEIHRVLRKGGKCLIETPNRHSGPGDVSRFFGDEPQGFHLKEYSVAEMLALFRKSRFTRVSVLMRGRVISGVVAMVVEACWSLLPRMYRRRRTFGLSNPLYVAIK